MQYMKDKTKTIMASAFICATALAQEAVIVNEGFEDVSDDFLKKVYLDASSVKVENVPGFSTGEKSLVGDFSNSKEGYPLLVRYPIKGGVDLGCNVLKVSFDYKIISSLNNRECVVAIQRNNGGKIETDAVKYIPAIAGKSGKVELISQGKSYEHPIFFFISPKTSGAKIAIDNLKMEKVPLPEWVFKDNPIWGLNFSPFSETFLKNNPQLMTMTKEQFFPFIDRWGQFIHKEWPNKVHSDEDLKKRTAEEKKYYENISDVANLDNYMGHIDPKYKFEATGRFRTQKVNGKWFLITPEGNLFWSMGVNTVGLYAPTCYSERETYFADYFNGGFDKKYSTMSYQTRHKYKKPHMCFSFELRNMDLKYGPQWRQSYHAVVRNRALKWGINTLGCWTQGFVSKNAKVPYMHTASAGSARRLVSKGKLVEYWRPVPDYFDPKFRENTFKNIARYPKALKDSYCIGVFVDNELPWQNENLALGRAIVRSPADQPAKIVFKQYLQNKYKSIEALNKAWKSNYKDFSDFLARDDFTPSTKQAKADLAKIEEMHCDTYFKTCRDAVKAADPNALYISCRFAWSNEIVRRAATRYADIVAYNWYRDTTSDLKHPDGSVDKPIIIGEYHFGNQDAGVFGGGLRPRDTMAERIAANNKYITGALQNPYIVGAHWFRWSDQVTSGRDGDGENYSVGLVDICDTPIYPFVDSIRKLADTMYKTRLEAKPAK